MFEEKETNVSLAKVEGIGFVIVFSEDVYYKRPYPIGKADDVDMNPYERFVNAETLTDVLLCAEHFGPLCNNSYRTEVSDPDAITDDLALKTHLEFIGHKGKAQGFSKLKAISKASELQKTLFPDCSETEKTNIKKAVAAFNFNLNIYKSAIESGQKSIDLKIDSLEDWLAAIHDLRLACSWLVSAIEPENTAARRDLSPILVAGQTPLGIHYDGLLKNTSYKFESTVIHSVSDFADVMPPSQSMQERTAMNAFDLMHAGAKRKLDISHDGKNGRYYEINCPECAVTNVWEYFRDLFLKDRVSCCVRCGKVIVRERRGLRKTCSGNCRNYKSETNKTNPARKPGTSIGKSKNKSNERR